MAREMETFARRRREFRNQLGEASFAVRNSSVVKTSWQTATDAKRQRKSGKRPHPPMQTLFAKCSKSISRRRAARRVSALGRLAFFSRTRRQRLAGQVFQKLVSVFLGGRRSGVHLLQCTYVHPRGDTPGVSTRKGNPSACLSKGCVRATRQRQQTDAFGGRSEDSRVQKAASEKLSAQGRQALQTP